MKNSVFRRIFLYTGFIVLALLVLMLAGVRFWLDDYYMARQEDAIKSASQQIQKVLEERPDEVTEALSYYGENLGGTLLITTSSGQILYSGTSSGTWSNNMMNGMMGGHGRFDRMQRMGGIGVEDWLLYKTELADDYLLVARLAYAPVERTVSVLTWFMALLTLPLIAVGILLIYSLSKTITKPLVQLNTVAKKMKELDFSAKYQGAQEDEIGQLGQTFNELTVRLEETIGKLSRELEKEKTMESMRKEFVARVSHEIRTPVSVIRGYVEALEEGLYIDGEGRNKALGVITEESEKITKMTEDLLDLSQLESGQYRLEKKPVDFLELVNDVVEKFHFSKGRTHSFIWNVPETAIWVSGDPFRLEQVLNNLLNNAFTHVLPGGIVQLECKEEGEDVRITVFNQGESIPEEDLPYLWESFYKGKEEKKGNGVGLGLSIARNVLSLHQGSWGVKNRDDGVEFSFTLKKMNKE